MENVFSPSKLRGWVQDYKIIHSLLLLVLKLLTPLPHISIIELHHVETLSITVVLHRKICGLYFIIYNQMSCFDKIDAEQ
jgi:hypothetical protein